MIKYKRSYQYLEMTLNRQRVYG